MIRTLFFVYAYLLAAPSYATSVNKCTDEKGQTIFTQLACPDGSGGDLMHVQSSSQGMHVGPTGSTSRSSGASFQKEFEEELSEVDGGLAAIYKEWNDAVDIANGTARIALPGPVAKLQEIKRRAESYVVTECLESSKKSMITGMDKMIDAFLLFMKTSNDFASILFPGIAKFFATSKDDLTSCSR